jgi:uncharacterized protein (TIGR03437 family)
MVPSGLKVWCLFALAPAAIYCHAPTTNVPQGALRARGNRLVDAAGQEILLRGVVMPGLEAFEPTALDRETIAAMNRLTFGVLRQRWNMNCVRLPVGYRVWQRDGQPYLDRVGAIVRTANEAGLVVILAVEDDTPGGAGLPAPGLADFWRAWAAYFRDNPRVIFALFTRPAATSIPGHAPGRRQASDWQVWLRGGTLADGRRAAGMQDLMDAIRSTGAAQVVSAPGFHDRLGFQDFTAEFYVRDSNVLYEVHPYYHLFLTNAERTAGFGSLAARFPVYAGEWGLRLLEDLPACRAVPRELPRIGDLLFETMSYFDLNVTSWTAYSFQPGRLIRDFDLYPATRLDNLWTCGQEVSPQPGMGEFVLVWLTGDLEGFGALNPDLVASAAGGPAGAVAPGQVLAIYGFLIGPEPEVVARLDSTGLLPASLAGVQVLFDGVPAPLFSVGPYQHTVQAPFSIAGKDNVTVQAFFREIPSNAIKVRVAEAAPGIFAFPGSNQALAVNQDGSRNAAAAPSDEGSIVLLYATGLGQTTPPTVAGKPAQVPLARPALPVSLTIDGAPAEILYAGEAPGFVGLIQINARVARSSPPPPIRTARNVPVVLTVGGRSGLPRSIWIR